MSLVVPVCKAVRVRSSPLLTLLCPQQGSYCPRTATSSPEVLVTDCVTIHKPGTGVISKPKLSAVDYFFETQPFAASLEVGKEASAEQQRAVRGVPEAEPGGTSQMQTRKAVLMHVVDEYLLLWGGGCTDLLGRTGKDRAAPARLPSGPFLYLAVFVQHAGFKLQVAASLCRDGEWEAPEFSTPTFFTAEFPQPGSDPENHCGDMGTVSLRGMARVAASKKPVF